MLRLLASPATALLAALILVSARSAAAGTGALILTGARDARELRAVARELELRGALIHVFLPPDAAIGEVPPGAEPPPGSELDGRAAVIRPGEEPARFRAAWARAGGIFAALQQVRPRGPGGSFDGDAETTPPPPALAGAPGPAALADLDCQNDSWSSAYLLGDVSLGIVLMESVNPDPAENTEDWDTAREDAYVAEIVEASDGLATAYPDAGLDFFLHVERAVPTDVEPILHDSDQLGLWSADAMAWLGQPGAGAWVRDLRQRDGTAWGVAVFVADSRNDADGKFPDGRFAFAWIGGPSMVMTYDNDGWGLGGTDSVFAHELGHNFQALDEYASAGQPCDRRSGILQVENQNSAAGACLSAVACLMRANSFPARPYCSWSEGQLGLRDSNGDGVPDLRDQPPRSRIDPVDPNPVTVADLTVLGRASALPDPAESPLLSRHTLNTVAGVDFRLDGGAWTPAAPADGAYDSLCEDFRVALTALAEGWHDVETRATARLCEESDPDICAPPRTLSEVTWPKERFYVNTDCAEDPFEDNDRAGRETPVAAGTLPGLQLCAYDTDLYRVFLRAGASLDALVIYTVPAAAVFLEVFSPSGLSLGRTAGSGGTAAVAVPAAPETGWHVIAFTGTGDAETAYELTVTATCLDDRFAPNAAPAAAVRLNAGPTGDLQISPGDEDWWAISASAGADLTLSLTHAAALGDLDLELYAPDLTPLDQSRSGGDVETVTATGVAGGVHFARALGSGPAVRNRYELDLTTTACLDDLLENDDDLASARPISGRAEGRICAGDADWYRLDVARPSFFRSVLNYADPARELDLELLDGLGVSLGRASGGAGQKRLDREPIAPGSYYLRVSAPAVADVAYNLTARAHDNILLHAVRERADVVLDWSDAGIDCYWVRRNADKTTWAGSFETVVDLAVAGEEAGHDATAWRDAGRVPDGTLWYYTVDPTACSHSLLSAAKAARPYPVHSGPDTTLNPIEYTILAHNDGREPASSVTIHDDMPPGFMSFTVLEIPPGATDNSSPTGGTWGAGYVQIDGIAVAPESAARVRFSCLPRAGSTNVSNWRNQGRVTGLSASGKFLDVLTDDPATHAAFDSTDVLTPLGWYPIAVTAMWNQDVDVDLRVVDPCGNAVGPADAPSAECPTGNLQTFSGGPGGCGDPFPWGWTEQVHVGGTLAAAPGTYEVWLRYTESRDTPASPCRHGGLEDVVVLLEKDKTWTWRWVVLDPTATDWIRVGEIVYP